MAERRRTRTTASRRQTEDTEEPEVSDSDEAEPEDLDSSAPEDLDDDEPEDLDEDEDQPRPARRSNSHLTAGQAAKLALSHMSELTTRRPEGITGVQRVDDGWLVGVEVVEDRRIPSSSDILAIYETTIDAEGELLSYRRVRRYIRGRGDGSEESR